MKELSRRRWQHPLPRRLDGWRVRAGPAGRLLMPLSSMLLLLLRGLPMRQLISDVSTGLRE